MLFSLFYLLYYLKITQTKLSNDKTDTKTNNKIKPKPIFTHKTFQSKNPGGIQRFLLYRSIYIRFLSGRDRYSKRASDLPGVPGLSLL